jgi:hypothetical protein
MQEAQKTQNPKKDTSISEADSRESAEYERSGRSKLPPQTTRVDRNPLKKIDHDAIFCK